MKNKRLQQVSINKTQLDSIKGGYKYVSGAAEAASFIGTAVDIRLGGGKEDVNRNRSLGGFSFEITMR